MFITAASNFADIVVGDDGRKKFAGICSPDGSSMAMVGRSRGGLLRLCVQEMSGYPQSRRTEREREREGRRFGGDSRGWTFPLWSFWILQTAYSS
jgi:hypothetical protein